MFRIRLQKLNSVLRCLQPFRLAALFSLTLIFIFTPQAGTTHAWFTDTNEQNFSFTSGKVHFELSATESESLMIPGQNFFTDISLLNFSTIKTNLRLKIEYDYWDYVEDTPTLQEGVLKMLAPNPSDTTQYLRVSLDPDYIYDEDNDWWVFDGEIPVAADPIAGTSLSLLVDDVETEDIIFCYDGATTGNVFQDRDVSVTVTFQAKQSEGVDWDDIGTFVAFG